ncbi:putative esterase [Gordonia araii NBRC 100433]|uniref:Putative esterase n=1 Tax=Gordonia araii NBRC 100433 TaxID=1073574 RepID=G7GX92_9ACTN|nr:SGNH/GDSL hydrolase family protein [Gordonia araii]NNG98990.1 SGNH/GDSL hydrolase family protein [Gordonia araii NBRC 100433]GAB08217.1 putative esterase [Gordonia araii NBRC 100433]
MSGVLVRGTRLAAVGVGMLAAGALLAAPADAAPLRGAEYVALGDSAAAGPLIEPQDRSSPGCLRAERNYPAVIAQRVGARLRDATCSSARSENVYATPQRTVAGVVPVQASALSARTRLVTLTIGLNDVGMFPIALSCADIPGSAPCSQRYRRGGPDDLGVRINAAGAKWGRTLDAIRRHAPNAKVVVVGYGTYIRKGGCAAQPIRPADADFFRSVVAKANRVMAAQAQRRGMQFVDIGPMSEGHDMCAAPGRQYFYGTVPSEFGVPLHPTPLGMVAIGRYVASRLG